MRTRFGPIDAVNTRRGSLGSLRSTHRYGYPKTQSKAKQRIAGCGEVGHWEIQPMGQDGRRVRAGRLPPPIVYALTEGDSCPACPDEGEQASAPATFDRAEIFKQSRPSLARIRAPA